MSLPDEDTKKHPKCRACGGTGWITLLISRQKCEECNGTGFACLEELDTQKVRRSDVEPYDEDQDEEHGDAILRDGLDDIDFDDGLEFDDESDDDDDMSSDPNDWPPAHITF